MPAIQHLMPRNASDQVTLTPTMMNLLIALTVLIAVGFLCIGVLLLLRSRRHRQKLSELDEPIKPMRTSSRISHRRHGANTAPISTNYAMAEKEMMLTHNEKVPTTPDSPVPEIRITFPEEVDEKGGQSNPGRVLKVTMSEKGGVGLEPFKEEELPPYQREERLQSLDLDRIGGLKEKEVKP